MGTSSSPPAERHPDLREELDGIVVIELLQHVIGQGQPADGGLVVGRQVGVEDGIGADGGCFPEFAVDPEAAGEEVEAAIVAADLVGAEEDAVLVADEELASRVAALD